MDSNENSQVCPWCQTEIVWDPEIGPEENCPHCLNELKGYRTVKLKLMQNGDELSLEEDEEDDSDDLDLDLDLDAADDLYGLDEPLEEEDLLDDYTVDAEPDPFAAKVISCMDEQENAPECSNCHELMLHAGTRTIPEGFVPRVPASLGRAFLKAPYVLNVYVCPSCFKTDEYLAKQVQESLVEAFGSEEADD